jgi:hypothetical protein
VKYVGAGSPVRTAADLPTRTPARLDAPATLEIETLSGSMTSDFGSGRLATLGAGAVGCIYPHDEALDAAVARLRGCGIENDALHVGAADGQRAQAAAERTGIRADVQADDPLRAMLPLDQEQTARGALDRAGLLGAALGALGGVALGLSPAGGMLAVPPEARLVANIALYLVLGAIVGSVLGAALAPQPSTHVGFRLIDGMQDGAFALIVTAPRARLDEVEKALEDAGGTGITRL